MGSGAGLTCIPSRRACSLTLAILSLGGFRQRDQAVRVLPQGAADPAGGAGSAGWRTRHPGGVAEAIAGPSTPGGEIAAREGAGFMNPCGGERPTSRPILVVPDKDLDATSVVLRYRARRSPRPPTWR